MSVFKKFDPCCSYEPPSKYHDGYTGFEILNKLINMINEFIGYINGLQSQIDGKEDSDNITNNRKLSENGNFTGTWFGETKTSVDSRINDCKVLSQTIIDWINTTPDLTIEIIDGGFYADGLTPEIIDAGNYTDPVTEEIDAGLYVYPCTCKII